MVGFLLVAVGLGAAPGAAPVGYVQSTGYYKKDSRPTLYQPLNLLDAREITSWCSATADHLAEMLTFGFKGPAKIDEIRVYTGNGFDEQTFKDFGRARKLALRTPRASQTVMLEDHRGLQAFNIDPPLEGVEITLEVLDIFPAEGDPDVPVCLTDVVFYSGGKPLNGAWLTQKLKYDRDRAALMGTWYGGYEGAPNRFLSFYYDDTYRMAFEPYEQQAKHKTYSGSYDASGTRLTVELPGKGRASARMRREEKKEGSALRYQLSLEGNLPDDWKGTFRNKR